MLAQGGTKPILHCATDTAIGKPVWSRYQQAETPVDKGDLGLPKKFRACLASTSFALTSRPGRLGGRLEHCDVALLSRLAIAALQSTVAFRTRDLTNNVT